mgnify:CR=1 FL=1
MIGFAKSASAATVSDSHPSCSLALVSIPHPAPDVYGAPDVPESFDEAVFLIEKPLGCTSFDVVKTVRRLTDAKVGHAGTLDPLATGLLIILVGRATKRMESFMKLPKTYEGTLRLGETTPSHDCETEVDQRADWQHLTGEMLDAARKPFLGYIEQLPPMYSAVKVRGERLYKKARRGETVTRSPRQVRIDAFEIIGRDGPDVTFRVECSKGTYIRSLAHDFGQELAVGAHLTSLQRTAIGPYRAADAWSLDSLVERLDLG